MNRMGFVSKAIGVSCVVWILSTAQGQAQAGVPDPVARPAGRTQHVTVSQTPLRLMTGAVSSVKGQSFSGLFLTEPGTGWILYRPTTPDEGPRIGFQEFQRRLQFEQPLGMVFSDPRLYVYDGAKKTVVSVLVRDGEAKQQVELISRLPQQPSHIAVSPHGLVAVIQGDAVYFLQKDGEPIRYPRSLFPDPIDLSFSSWNTLEVLDAKRNTLVSITFRRLSNGEIAFEDERSLPAPEEGSRHRWLSMSIFDGVVYLADEKDVYAYLASDKRLVPVAARDDRQDPIQRMALTSEGLYLMHADSIRRYPRMQPVDLALEGGPVQSQRALLALYQYLHRNGLLLTRTVRARNGFEQLEKLLFDNHVLVAPSSHLPSKLAPDGGNAPPPVSAEERAFMEIFCSLNAQTCRRASATPHSLKMTVPQGAEIRVPRVELLSRLGKEAVVLNGMTAAEHVAWRVPSPDLRDQAYKLLRRLNPDWSEADLASRTTGPAYVPAEQWTVIAAVPAVEYRNQDSALWGLTRQYTGAYIYGREGFTAQSAKALSLAFQPPPPASPDCQTLKKARRNLFTAIRYPVEYRPRPAPADGAAPGEEDEEVLLHRRVHQDAPRVGILEKAATVRTAHQAFCRDQAAPSWHQAVSLDLVAEPKPATYSTVAQDLGGAAVFSSEAHHGTHVAALIGGRQAECWSGLLPRARLLLVDLTDAGKVRRAIADAIGVDVRVFNVSQALEGDQKTLHDIIEQFKAKALFVAAAGPPPGGIGRVLSDGDEVPAPARWGRWGNVITVTGTNAAGQVLTQLNRGRRFVDLATLGEEVYSASEAPGSYGPATGSSQAAPIVTAAAAILMDPAGGGGLDPEDAKARLIATAEWDWTGAYNEAVWGGRLNFATAVRSPDRHVLVTTTGSQTGQLNAIVPSNDPIVSLTNAPTYFERQQARGAVAIDKIRFERILSLRKQPDGKFRVVLREPVSNHLKIVLDAELAADSKIECLSAELFDPQDAAFKPDAGVCASGIEISQIEEYFRGGAYQVDWPEL